MRMCCGVCHVPFHNDDMVFLDALNTITHQKCYSLDTNLEIKDLGTFKMIMDHNQTFESWG